MSSMSPADLAAYLTRTGLTLPDAPAPASGSPQKAQQPPARHLPPGVTILHATLPGEGVSVNAAYANVPGKGRVATKALKDWKRACANAMHRVILPHYPHAQPYLLELVFYGDWETLEGKPRRRDASNLTKADEDAVCAFLGLDDCWIYRLTVEKRHDPCNPRHVVTLTTL